MSSLVLDTVNNTDRVLLDRDWGGSEILGGLRFAQHLFLPGFSKNMGSKEARG